MVSRLEASRGAARGSEPRNPETSELDTPLWRWERKGNFSVRSTFRLLVDGGLRIAHGNFIWKTN